MGANADLAPIISDGYFGAGCTLGSLYNNGELDGSASMDQ